MWCLLAYLAAMFVGAVVWWFAPVASPFWRMAWADVAATLVVFGFSRGLNNTSIYDPYWSVAPVPMAAGWSALPAAVHGDALRQLVVVVLVAIWGARLTLNWLDRWRGNRHEDWRYVDIRAKVGRGYWLVSLFGLHLFPTLMVLLNLSNVYLALVVGRRPFGGLDALATVVTVVGIWCETVADRQLRDFVARNRDAAAFLEDGLWSVSRHPNYFGELCFWWGICFFAMAAAPHEWWGLAGPIAMTSMFWFVSIPLIDNHMLKKRPRYRQHMSLVSRLVPWLPEAPPPLGKSPR